MTQIYHHSHKQVLLCYSRQVKIVKLWKELVFSFFKRVDYC